MQRGWRPLIPAVACLVALFLLPDSFGGAPEPAAGPSAPGFPLRVVISRPGSLFHWIDSLANRSGGKTVGAYQRQYQRVLGKPDDRDRDMLVTFQQLRDAHALTRVAAPTGDGFVPRGYSPMLGIFLDAPSLDQAYDQLRRDLTNTQVGLLVRAIDHFTPKYDRVFADSRPLQAFRREIEKSSERARLDRFLFRVARFFGVDPAAGVVPRLVLIEVPGGSGTHAQAVGHNLLIEVPPGDRLANQASVVVHETSHFLFAKMDRAKRNAFAQLIARRGPRAAEAWNLLREALPTALGQGEAARTFKTATWSPRHPWYHTAAIDEYAKALHPLVKDAIAHGASFDLAFLNAAIDLLPNRPMRTTAPVESDVP